MFVVVVIGSVMTLVEVFFKLLKEFSVFIHVIFHFCLFIARYGMRYVAMSLRVALAEKFPEVPESEILKVTSVFVLGVPFTVCNVFTLFSPPLPSFAA